MLEELSSSSESSNAEEAESSCESVDGKAVIEAKRNIYEGSFGH